MKQFLERFPRAREFDVGYLVVGLTVIYAISGIAINHIDDWNANFKAANRVGELSQDLPEDAELFSVTTAMMRYARTVALANLGRIAEAKAYLDATNHTSPRSTRSTPGPRQRTLPGRGLMWCRGTRATSATTRSGRSSASPV